MASTLSTKQNDLKIHILDLLTKEEEQVKNATSAPAVVSPLEKLLEISFQGKVATFTTIRGINFIKLGALKQCPVGIEELS